MTVQDLRNLIVECLMESDIPVGGLVGRVKLSGWAFDETPNPSLQSELNKIVDKYVRTLDIDVFVYTKHIKLKTLNATKDAPKGTGSSFMRELTKFADDNNLVIVLTPAVKGYGSAGFKKTSSYGRLVDFYKRFGFVSKYSKSSYRPNYPESMFRDPKKSSINERNVKVGPYTYYGFSEQDEDNIQSMVHRYHQSNEFEKEKIRKDFEELYQRTVGYNPVLSKINVDIPNYNSKNTPVMDLVFGAISGIPPEDIKNYIEVTKGAGGTSIPATHKLKALTPYIQIEPKED